MLKQNRRVYMAKVKKPSPKDYDRWGNSGIKVISKPTKKTVKKGK